MNVSVRRILTVAFVVLYLSCETSAAAIDASAVAAGDGAIGSTADPGAIEAAVVGTYDDVIESSVDPEDEAEATTTAVAAVEDCTSDISFKCGILECPNGSFCFIKEIPSDDRKTITKTTQCRDEHGNVLDEKITTEDVPAGQIPFTAETRKTVNEGKNGSGFFGSSSYVGSAVGGGKLGSIIPGRLGSLLPGRFQLDGNADKENEWNAIDFDLNDGVGRVGFLNYFDNVLKRTSDLMHNIFGNFPC